MKNFLENLKIVFSESQYDLCMKNQETDLHYLQLQEDYNNLFDEIRDRLGDQRKLMLRLEELQTQKDSIDDDLIYLQGFIDCAALLKYIKVL